MVLPSPPTSPGFPTDLGANDINGRGLTLSQISLILAGAIPTTGETPAAAVDTVLFSNCPIGRRRVITGGYAYSDTPGAYVIWQRVEFDGTVHNISGPEMVEGDLAGTFTPGAKLPPMVLGEGQSVRAHDPFASGGNTTASIFYADVEVR